jgi:crotonobetainyl-CoA:carnitine CoA-transferase CaiB-like acyl-CoA transferase
MEGIRILDLADHTFVPAASAILSDWGAEVIKIEHITRGDAARGLASTGMAIFAGDVSPILEHANRGKLSLALDLNQDEGRDILYQLAAISDVFLTNKMPSVREKLKTDVDIGHNRTSSTCGTGYGNRGPDADAGLRLARFWARSGVPTRSRPPTCPAAQPARPALGDSIGAMTIAGASRPRPAPRAHRQAQVVDVSLLSTAVGRGTIAVSQDIGMAWQAPPSASPPRRSTRSWLLRHRRRPPSCSRCCRASYWPEVCERLGRTDLVDDPGSTPPALMENAAGAEIVRALEIKQYARRDQGG